jgi:hypothetical protein
MDKVIDLAVALRDTVRGYVRPSINSTMYLLENPDHAMFAAISVPSSRNPQSRIVVLGRVVHDKIIIETDVTDKPLYEALMQAGVPRAQIILAYQGETP